MDAIVVYVTVGNTAEGDKIAQTLVAEKLVACVNRVGPIHATYHWQGHIQQDQEYLLMMKTRQSLLEQLIPRIQSLHSYDVPEIIALPIISGLPAYLNWIEQETTETHL